MTKPGQTPSDPSTSAPTAPTEGAPEPPRPALSLHLGSGTRPRVAAPAAGLSPRETSRALASMALVAAAAGCWLAVAVATTAPLLAAQGLMQRAAKGPERSV